MSLQNKNNNKPNTQCPREIIKNIMIIASNSEGVSFNVTSQKNGITFTRQMYASNNDIISFIDTATTKDLAQHYTYVDKNIKGSKVSLLDAVSSIQMPEGNRDHVCNMFLIHVQKKMGIISSLSAFKV